MAVLRALCRYWLLALATALFALRVVYTNLNIRIIVCTAFVSFIALIIHEIIIRCTALAWPKMHGRPVVLYYTAYTLCLALDMLLHYLGKLQIFCRCGRKRKFKMHF